MFARKLLASLLSVMLVFCTVPTSAIADDVVSDDVEVNNVVNDEVEVVEAKAKLLFRINAAGDEAQWTAFETAAEALEAAKGEEAEKQSEAEEQGADEGQEAAEPAEPAEPAASVVPVTSLELKLENAGDAAVELSTRAANAEWPDEWVERTLEDGEFADLKIRLTQDLQETYDVWYRVHAGGAWLDWATNGEAAAPSNQEIVDDVQVLLLTKEDSAAFKETFTATNEAPAEEITDNTLQVPTATVAESQEVAKVEAEAAAVPAITYQVHGQTYGWQGSVTNGALAGTTGKSKRLEAIRISLPAGTDGGVSYRVHGQTYGWQGAVSNGELAGTTGKSKRLEGIQIWLTGNVSNTCDVWYRVHIQTYGWLDWTKNGELAGSTGQSKRIEAIQIMTLPKNSAAPGGSSRWGRAAIQIPKLRYRAHTQTYGWLGWVNNGSQAGTTGQYKRMEALQVDITNSDVSGEIQVNAHTQTYGWLGWKSEGEVAGTTGQSKRMEGVQIRLTGELANKYDVWYRAHAQTYGWMGWTSNGASAGTQGLSKRLEAVQIQLVPKGAGAPGSTDRPFVKGVPAPSAKQGYQNPSGYYQVSSKNVTITSAAQWPWNYVTPSRIGVWASRDDCVNAFIQRAREYVGTPYMWDYSCAPGVGVDCIGLVYQCAYATGMDMGGGTGTNDFNPWAHYISGPSGWHSHDANNFWNYGKAIHVPLSSRRVGDVISWNGHVAVYMGNDQIIEAYTGSGVIWNSLWAHGTPRGCIRLFQ